MAGETEERPSGLTIDTLRLLIEAKMAESDRRYEQRFLAQQTSVDVAIAAAKEATTKAENATEKRFEGVNEFRAQLNDQAGTFISRNEANTRMDSLAEKITDISDRLNLLAGRDAGKIDSRGVMIAAVGLMIATASIVTAVIIALSR